MLFLGWMDLRTSRSEVGVAFFATCYTKGTLASAKSLVKAACISSPSHSRKASSSVSTDILGQNSPSSMHKDFGVVAVFFYNILQFVQLLG